ncbi:MAG: N-acetylglucosamine-6-phosphate deacetylase [Clostridia bacterium]|nr:N-acetylglucosamine-6-phosphate deacetylase [Clostridia bacterium]
MKRIKSDKILLGERILSGYVYLEGEKITLVSAEDLPVAEEYDMTDFYVCPGFIDLHTHGGGGNPFEGSVEEIVAGCNFHLAHGTTSICPTVSAAPFESMAASVKRIREAMGDPRVRGTILGAHLEGPYLSQKQSGAQCADFIEPPRAEDYLPLLKEHGDVITRWSYAPENDENQTFAKALRQYGVLAAAGHTDATYPELLPAVEQGCRLVTHLYSCTSTVTRDHGFRNLGVIESAFLLDEMDVEIICDGKHLPPELIRLIYKIKGADRIALITDSLALAGTDQRHGWMQSTEFIIEDGVCKLMDRSAFAGSIATADRLLSVAVKEAGIALTDAVKMLTATPARILGLSHKGVLAPGADADLVILDGDLKIQAVFARGQKI